MLTMPPLTLHRFVPKADEQAYLARGWMWERPLNCAYPRHAGIWMIWPCGCPPREPRGVPPPCGGWWHRFIPTTHRTAASVTKRMGGAFAGRGEASQQ
jgi:hypothetical protein